MNLFLETLKDKNVLVVGLGKSGLAVIDALVKADANIYVQDSKQKDKISDEVLHKLEEANAITYFGVGIEDVSAYDMLVLSPGVPPAISFVKEAREKQIEVIGELEFAYRCSDANYIAITGTNGKTTTTSLVGEIFKNANKDTRVVGNIGNPVVTESLTATEDTYMVTEVSSFQLETISKFRPHIAAILNLTPDHMDRHKTMENYGYAKANITKKQQNDDYLVINFDDKEALKYVSGTNAKLIPFSRLEMLKFGVFVKDDNIVIRNDKDELIRVCPTSSLNILGTHNVENALAATGIAYFAGIDVATIKETLETFKAVEHRLEFVDEIDGVKFINDSKGTNPDAAIKAIEAIDDRIIIIAGGYDKNANFDEFVKAFRGKVKTAILLGATAVKIKATAESQNFQNTIIVQDMKTCVEEAFRIAESGDTVLLSPACASWDMYKSFEQRGEDFKQCVASLK